MPDDTEANNAIKQLNGAEYVGRSMVVKEALPSMGLKTNCGMRTI